MGAPKGNNFWELRSKHGADKLFATPELMWEAACEYFEYCIDNPWVKVEQTKSPGKPFKDLNGEITWPDSLVEVPTSKPFTLTGLCLYLGCSSGYFRTFKLTASKDFLAIVARIEETIFTQQFEGASVGAYNANIIARSLGLADKTELTGANGQPIETTSKHVVEFKDYSKDNS